MSTPVPPAGAPPIHDMNHSPAAPNGAYPATEQQHAFAHPPAEGDYSPVTDSEPMPLKDPVPVQRSHLTAAPPPEIHKVSLTDGIAPVTPLYGATPRAKAAPAKPAPKPVTPIEHINVAPGAEIAGGQPAAPMVALPDNTPEVVVDTPYSVSESVRKHAAKMGVDLAEVTPSKGGKIQRKDVDAYIASRGSSASPGADPAQPAVPPIAPAPLVPITGDVDDSGNFDRFDDGDEATESAQGAVGAEYDPAAEAAGSNGPGEPTPMLTPTPAPATAKEPPKIQKPKPAPAPVVSPQVTAPAAVDAVVTHSDKKILEEVADLPATFQFRIRVGRNTRILATSAEDLLPTVSEMFPGLRVSGLKFDFGDGEGIYVRVTADSIATVTL